MLETGREVKQQVKWQQSAISTFSSWETFSQTFSSRFLITLKSLVLTRMLHQNLFSGVACVIRKLHSKSLFGMKSDKISLENFEISAISRCGFEHMLVVARNRRKSSGHLNTPLCRQDALLSSKKQARIHII